MCEEKIIFDRFFPLCIDGINFLEIHKSPPYDFSEAELIAELNNVLKCRKFKYFNDKNGDFLFQQDVDSLIFFPDDFYIVAKNQTILDKIANFVNPLIKLFLRVNVKLYVNTKLVSKYRILNVNNKLITFSEVPIKYGDYNVVVDDLSIFNEVDFIGKKISFAISYIPQKFDKAVNFMLSYGRYFYEKFGIVFCLDHYISYNKENKEMIYKMLKTYKDLYHGVKPREKGEYRIKFWSFDDFVDFVNTYKEIDEELINLIIEDSIERFFPYAKDYKNAKAILLKGDFIYTKKTLVNKSIPQNFVRVEYDEYSGLLGFIKNELECDNTATIADFNPNYIICNDGKYIIDPPFNYIFIDGNQLKDCYLIRYTDQYHRYKKYKLCDYPYLAFYLNLDKVKKIYYYADNPYYEYGYQYKYEFFIEKEKKDWHYEEMNILRLDLTKVNADFKELEYFKYHYMEVDFVNKKVKINFDKKAYRYSISNIKWLLKWLSEIAKKRGIEFNFEYEAKTLSIEKRYDFALFLKNNEVFNEEQLVEFILGHSIDDLTLSKEVYSLFRGYKEYDLYKDFDLLNDYFKRIENKEKFNGYIILVNRVNGDPKIINYNDTSNVLIKKIFIPNNVFFEAIYNKKSNKTEILERNSRFEVSVLRVGYDAKMLEFLDGKKYDFYLVVSLDNVDVGPYILDNDYGHYYGHYYREFLIFKDGCLYKQGLGSKDIYFDDVTDEMMAILANEEKKA